MNSYLGLYTTGFAQPTRPRSARRPSYQQFGLGLLPHQIAELEGDRCRKRQ